VVEEGLGEALLHGLHIREEQVRPDQAHTTIDVEADASGRDDRLGIAHVKGSDVADGEAIAAVHVR